MLRLSRPLGSLLLALLLAALFIPSLPGQTYWQRVLQDAGHGAIFAGVAIVLLAMRPAAAPGRRLRGDFTACFVVAVTLGIATELLQHFLPHRQVSALDVLHDAAGAALGLAAIALVERRSGACADRAGMAVAILLGAVVLLAWEPLRCARAYAERANAFPTLAPMGRIADAQFAGARNGVLSHATLPATWRQAGESDGLRLEFEPGARVALELIEAVPDWRGHSVLALDLTNPGPQPAHFILRVLDARHDWTHEDRLNLPVRIPAQTRMTVRVALTAVEHAPVGRRMDLGDIANVMLFATAPLPGDAFYVSRIWLEE